MDRVAKTQKTVTVLFVSPFEEDQRCLDQIFTGYDRKARPVCTCRRVNRE